MLPYPSLRGAKRRGDLALSTSRTRDEIATPRLRVARDDGWGVSLRRLFHNPDLVLRQAVQLLDQLVDLPVRGVDLV